MPQLRATVQRTNVNLGAQLNEAVAVALREAAEVGAQVSRQVAGQRPGATGDMQNITVSEPRGTPLGWEIEVTSHAAWAWFQEFGTLGNRKRKLKRNPRSSTSSGRQSPSRAAGTGITPLHFLSAGRTAARRAFLPALQRRLR